MNADIDPVVTGLLILTWFCLVPDFLLAKEHPMRHAIASMIVPALAAVALAREEASSPLPALSLAVADAGGVVWSGAFGKADLEFDVAATPEHVFRLGSVSKAVTATAAAESRGGCDR